MAVGLVVGGIATYKATQLSTETQSKATESQLKRVVSWEFNGKTTEGWKQTGLQSLKIANKKLHAIMGASPGTASITQKDIKNGELNRGLKNFKIRVAVGSAIEILPGLDPETADKINTQDTCSIDSDGNTVCSGDAGGSISDGVDEGGRGPDGSDDIVPIWETVPTGSEACVVKPTCAPGRLCEETLLYPQGGWCPTGAPVPTCTPVPPCSYIGEIGENGERIYCVTNPLPPGAISCPIPTPNCTVRPSCLDAEPACRLPEPIDGWCPTGTPGPVPTPVIQNFVFTITYGYRISDVSGGRGRPTAIVYKTVSFTGKADSKPVTYTIKIPEINKITLRNLKITFTSGLSSGEKASFDWIHVMGKRDNNPTGRTTPPIGD